MHGKFSRDEKFGRNFLPQQYLDKFWNKTSNFVVFQGLEPYNSTMNLQLKVCLVLFLNEEDSISQAFFLIKMALKESKE